MMLVLPTAGAGSAGSYRYRSGAQAGGGAVARAPAGWRCQRWTRNGGGHCGWPRQPPPPITCTRTGPGCSRSRLQVSWPKWPTWPGQSLRLPKITAIEQRNRKDHPSERAVIRNPGFAGRRFWNSLQIRPHSEHDLEQIRIPGSAGSGLRFASLGWPLAITPVSSPGVAVDRRVCAGTRGDRPPKSAEVEK